MLRFIEMSDLPQLVNLDKHCHPHPWNLSQFQDLVKSGVWGVLIEVDGEILAYTFASITIDTLDILNIAVSPKARRSGFGILLLTALMTQAKACGCEKLMLEVRLSNLNAQSLYRWANFEQIARRFRYYYNMSPKGPRDYEDALTMKCQIIDEAEF